MSGSSSSSGSGSGSSSSSSSSLSSGLSSSQKIGTSCGPQFSVTAPIFSFPPYEQASHLGLGPSFPGFSRTEFPTSLPATIDVHKNSLPLNAYYAFPFAYTSAYSPSGSKDLGLHGLTPRLSPDSVQSTRPANSLVQPQYSSAHVYTDVSVKHETPSPTVLSTPSSSVSSPELTDAKGEYSANEHLVDLPEPIEYHAKGPEDGYACRIPGCMGKIVANKQGGRRHVILHHLPKEIREGRARKTITIECRWVGKNQKPCDASMQVIELGRHIVEHHIKPTIWHCPVCKTFKRNTRKDVAKKHVVQCCGKIHKKQGGKPSTAQLNVYSQVKSAYEFMYQVCSTQDAPSKPILEAMAALAETDDLFAGLQEALTHHGSQLQQ